MTGSLQIKSGYYYMVLNFKDKTGKRQPKWIATGLKVKDNKRKAEAMLRETLKEYEDTEYIEPTKTLFSTFLFDWLELHKLEVQLSTYNGYKHMADKHIVPYFSEKGITLHALKPIDIQRYYSYCQQEKNLSPNTVIKHHQLIHRCLEFARKNRYVRENVADFVDKPRKVHFEKAFLEIPDIKRLIEEVKGEKIETAVLLAIYFGLRRSEILGLTWDEVDFNRNLVRIRKKGIRAKNDKGKMSVQISDDLKTYASYREFPLSGEIREHLIQVKERIEDNRNFFGCTYCEEYIDFVCVNEQGRLISPDYITSKFSDIADKLGFDKGITFHSLRHSCGSMLLYLGFDLKQIQIWLGHSNYQTTADIYAHTYNNSKQTIINKLSEVL